MSIEPGTIVAERYRVHALLGKGGMGEVFSAENTRTGRMVALKVLRSESKQKKSAIERFRREARAAGVIKSDFVTQVLDVEDDPEHGIVLVFELLEGESLVDRLKRAGPIAMVELWPMVEAVWIGLADAHAQGIVHRDLKPSNVFLETKSGTLKVKILDFGISKLPKTISTESLTQLGQSLGTFSFMPPEQIGRAKNVDHRADIYACTTLIFQGLSGKLPYQAKNVVAMMELKTKQDPRSLAEAMGKPVDARLEAFIAKGLARNPDHRFQTALEALAGWRALRPEGAVSLVGTAPAKDSQPWRPPEEEAKTLMMSKYGPDVPLDVPPSQAEGPLPSGYPRNPPPREESEPSTLSNPRSDPRALMAQAQMPAPVALPPMMPAPLMQPPLPMARPPLPSGPSGTMMMPDGPPPLMDPRQAAPAPPKSGMRTALTLVLGAIGLMLVGFLAVALVLRFIH